MAKRDRTPRADGWKDPNPRTGDQQSARYLEAKAGPTWRNLGPKGGGMLGPRPLRTHHVCIDVTLAPGTMVNGKPVAAGTWIEGYPVRPACHSRRQALNALRQVKCRYPSAYVVSWLVSTRGGRIHRYTGSLQAPRQTDQAPAPEAAGNG